MVASAPSSAAPDASGRYARREPENTVLHRVVRVYLETFLRTVRVVAILAHLGLPTEAPPIARAQRPAFAFA